MLISFGIFSPPLGAPFSIYPLICSFVMGVRTGSTTQAIIYGSVLTAIFLPIGGWLGFLLSRHVLMDWAKNLSAKFPTLEALHSVFSQPSQSLKIMILLRLSPILPSSILNYVLGTFPVRNREFLLSYFFSAVFWGIPPEHEVNLKCVRFSVTKTSTVLGLDAVEVETKFINNLK
ncbi:hypothetical protein TL16_g00256 [Triparma laevis f. inornata]|uniref:VTT domain-containing protein n=1 Tax=Triparma laevis f. inornata TaxID=1714386 RepID=A0A9W6Z9Q6_9STRA|nr:hypothetical protein TL16_g00256 [Triparma laevis f. inornata]